MQTVINFKTESTTKKQAQALAQSAGLSLTDLMNISLKQMIKNKQILISLTEEPSDVLIRAMKRSRKEYLAGKASPVFETGKDAIAWLESKGV